MIQEKKKRTDLQCPDFLRKEWEKGTEEREQMAQCLQAVNWDKAGHVVSFLSFSIIVT